MNTQEKQETKQETETQEKEYYSYSKLNTYLTCPRRFKLKYIDENYSNAKTLPLELGTLIHYIQEQIGNSLVKKEKIDYSYWKDFLYNANVETDKFVPNDDEEVEDTRKYKSNHNSNEKEKILGINALIEKYPKDFYALGKSGRSYEDKIQEYVDNITSLEKMHKNTEWEIIGCEVSFEYEYRGVILHGYIDRIDQNKITKELRVIDYKTQDSLFEDKDLSTPLQMAIYGLACVKLYGKMPTEFVYELTFWSIGQHGGTSKDWIQKAMEKADKVLIGVRMGDFEPKQPLPLCYWCDFSNTNPNADNKLKQICPYYTLWTREKKSFFVNKKYNKEQEEKEIEFAKQMAKGFNVNDF